MIKEMCGIVISFIYFFLILLFPRLFPKVNEEYSRKFVHIMIGNWWLIALYFFTNVYTALVVPVAFCIISYYSIKKNSPNGLLSFFERREANEKKSYGIIVYPISLAIMAIVSYACTNNHYLGGVGIVALSYGDGMAAVIGKLYPKGKYTIGYAHKTLAGSIAMLIMTFVMLIVYLVFIVGLHMNTIIYRVIITAIIATIVEAITPRGFDNLSVPISALVTYMLCISIL